MLMTLTDACFPKGFHRIAGMCETPWWDYLFCHHGNVVFSQPPEGWETMFSQRFLRIPDNRKFSHASERDLRSQRGAVV